MTVVARLDGPIDPPAVVAALAASGLLGEYVAYERQGSWLIGGLPAGQVVVEQDVVRSSYPGPALPWHGTPWPQVATILARCPVPGWTALGWVSFELAGAWTGPRSGVLARLMVPGLRIDLDARGATIHAPDAALRAELTAVVRAAGVGDVGWARPVDVNVDATGYREQVGKAIADIRAGRLEKVVLSRTVPVEFPIDFPATYLLGRRDNTPARSYLLDLGGWQVAGFSPENVVEVSPDGRFVTQPLAGTTARSGDVRTDAERGRWLRSDPKEVHEHAVSVRIAFDEVTRVAAPGSVRISEFMAVKERGSVAHLGSRVEGVLPPGSPSWTALDAVFPAVTASGIPKPEACALIAELEDTPRRLYAGAVLMADAGGTLDAALVLRSAYRHADRNWLRAGAGIVAASTPAREFEETCEKLGSVAPYLVPQR